MSVDGAPPPPVTPSPGLKSWVGGEGEQLLCADAGESLQGSLRVVLSHGPTYLFGDADLAVPPPPLERIQLGGVQGHPQSAPRALPATLSHCLYLANFHLPNVPQLNVHQRTLIQIH